MILPIMYIFNWALMFTGPFFYPVAYRYYIYLIYVIISGKSAITLAWSIKSIYDGIVLCRKYDRHMESKNEPENEEKQKLRLLENS